MKNLCLAGGVALNCVGNGRILREGPFDNIWIQPAAGDAGGALGVALFIWHQLLGKPRTPQPGDAQHGSLLGPGVLATTRFDEFLDAPAPSTSAIDDEHVLCERSPTRSAGGKVVGWFQGRMEFGPRALGARSILGDARSPQMQSRDEPEDQVPRRLPSVRAGGAARSAADEYFDVDRGQREPVHAAGRAGQPQAGGSR